MEINNNLNKNEKDLIKTKKKHIKVLATGVAGLVSMNIFNILKAENLLKSIESFVFGGSVLFMNSFVIPNYFLIVVLLLVGSSAYVYYKSISKPNGLKGRK